MSELATAADKPTAPRDIKPRMKAYAFERSLGLPPAEACRRAGGKVENGHATNWERNRGVQEWIAYYRSLAAGQEEYDQYLSAKRQRMEDGLNLIAYANMDDFVKLVPNGDYILPVLDLTRINNMSDWERRAAMAAVKTIRYTEHGPTFEMHDKLGAKNQLRDMHGFKSVNKTALTDPSGQNPAAVYIISEQPMTQEEWERQRVGTD